MDHYPKWIGTDPDDPARGVIVQSVEEEEALTGIQLQDVLDLGEPEEPEAEPEVAAPKKK